VPREPFDSNCITPGTEFMAALSAQLAFFIRHKVETDAHWRAPHIILSGHEVPGEGEHKIMEYLRREKMQPGFAPNLRHCIYGAAAPPRATRARRLADGGTRRQRRGLDHARAGDARAALRAAAAEGQLRPAGARARARARGGDAVQGGAVGEGGRGGVAGAARGRAA